MQDVITVSKSMYSLILIDDVVKAVDRLAYERGVSRSGLINRILAEYLSMVTPEKWVEDIFSHVAGAADGENTLQILSQAPGGMLQVRSVLRYKYNPTIRYTIEIPPRAGVCTGSFRVLSRTQSPALLGHLQIFFQIWARIEEECLGSAGHALPSHEIAGGRYWRELQLGQGGGTPDSRLVGRAIGEYLQLFDKALDAFFLTENTADPQTSRRIAAMYNTFLQKGSLHL